MQGNLFNQIVRLYNGSEEGRVCVTSTVATIKGMSLSEANRFYDGGVAVVSPAIKELLDWNQELFVASLKSCAGSFCQEFGQTNWFEE